MGATPAQPPLISLLAHDIRWRLIMALAQSDRRVQELVAIVDRPMNLVSYHLKLLRDGRLVQERRSSADARDIYYSLDLEEIAAQLRMTETQLHPGFAAATPSVSATPVTSSAAYPVRVLFLCTHNSARSQMAEALLRQMGGSTVVVWSAGTEPAGVHRLAVQVMAEMGIDIGGQNSTALSEFADRTFDYVITVCDRAREECPVFPDDPAQIHWSIPDPVAVTGDAATQLEAFRTVRQQLAVRLRYFLAVATRVA